MSSLPDWLKQAKETVPEWIEKVKHPGSAGRHRFAIDAYEPYDLDSSCMVENVRLCIDGIRLNPERKEWLEYLVNLQDPETGWLIDEAMEQHICFKQPDGKMLVPVPDNPDQRKLMKDYFEKHKLNNCVMVFSDELKVGSAEGVRGWTTRNGINTILELGGMPKYKVNPPENNQVPKHKNGEPIKGPPHKLITKEDTEEYLSRLDWLNSTSWGAGSWAGTLVSSYHLNQRLGDKTAETVVNVAIDWLKRKQNPQTGAWSDLGKVRLNAAVNIIFKIWAQAIPTVNFPVQYPEKVVDLCLRALKEDPALTCTPDACSIYDVALVLDIALRFCDHRRDEVAELAAQALPRIEPLYRDDGAFSYMPFGSLFTHGGLHLAPVKMQSDAPGTAIAMGAISLLCNLCGLREELGWIPTTEARLGLAKG